MEHLPVASAWRGKPVDPRQVMEEFKTIITKDYYENTMD
jgi:hypothetical protein